MKENLELLCMLYALTELQKDCRPNFESGYFQPAHGDMLDEAVKVLMQKLRP